MLTLKELYKKIPKIKCPDGCTDCCTSVVMLRSEAIAAGYDENIKHTSFDHTTLKCKHAKNEEGCSIYKNRPLTCRLFGAVQAGPMSCRKVLTPTEDLLTIEEAANIYAQYLVLLIASKNEPEKRFVEVIKEHDEREHKKGNLMNRALTVKENDSSNKKYYELIYIFSKMYWKQLNK